MCVCVCVCVCSAEEIVALHNADFDNFKFCEFDRKQLRREAFKLVAQGDRSTRIRRRIVNAISSKIAGNASQFAQANLSAIVHLDASIETQIAQKFLSADFFFCRT